MKFIKLQSFCILDNSDYENILPPPPPQSFHKIHDLTLKVCNTNNSTFVVLLKKILLTVTRSRTINKSPAYLYKKEFLFLKMVHEVV